MKVVKITALWCSACIIMNKVWAKFIKKHEDLDVLELDYDLDEEAISNYDVGKLLPVFIIYDESGKELGKIVGEYSEDEFENKFKEVCDLNEKNN